LDAILSTVSDSDTLLALKSSPEASTSRREARTEAILRAVLEELAEVGYSALSIEAVALRVGIAKTTVYRRYPTKVDLVRAAIRHFVDSSMGELPDTGALRSDLVALGRQIVQLASSVFGQGLFRTRLLDRAVPELDEIGKEFDRERECLYRDIATRAVARGELSSESDFETMVQVLSGALLFKLVIKKQSVNELEVVRIVDMLINGASKPTHPRRNGRV
jgi:AcrR family transcriptional regulator